MAAKKKLSDTEFEVMKVVWSGEVPATTNDVMERLGREKNWKLPTILTLMTRLVEKGYLRTEKPAKERQYYPLVEKEDYLTVETKDFMKLYHGNSLSSLVSMLYEKKEIREEDIEELSSILKQKGKK